MRFWEFSHRLILEKQPFAYDYLFKIITNAEKVENAIVGLPDESVDGQYSDGQDVADAQERIQT